MEMIRSRLRKIRSGTKPSTATAIIAVIWNETAISASSQNKNARLAEMYQVRKRLAAIPH